MITDMLFVLDENNLPQRCHVLADWERWMHMATRTKRLCVGGDTVGDVRLCTSFLGVVQAPHRGHPLLFESKTFNDVTGRVEVHAKYDSWRDARDGHKAILISLKQEHRAQSSKAPPSASEPD